VQFIKTKQLLFDPDSALEFDDLNYPFLVIYADDWHLNGHFAIRRTTSINLNGANGANAAAPPPTPPGYGIAGNDGLPGLPGRQGQRGMLLPQVIIIAQRTFFLGVRANPIQIDGVFNFDGVDGGNGGDGGDGSDGTDGNRGSPAQDGFGIGDVGDCAAGPGQGGRGGNAGLGGWPGYGGDGGDGAPMFMFVAPDELDNFRAVQVSLKAGQGGGRGNYGNPGRPGKGGPEGDYSQTRYCYSVGRIGRDGVVPRPCPAPEVRINLGLPGTLEVTDYLGFEELGN
jgi:hypothetical protein